MAEKGFGAKEINLIGSSGTPTIESPGNLNLNANNVAISTNVSIGGTLTVTGNVSVGGTLTYEDVTNIDSVGIVTARQGVRVNADSANPAGNSATNYISVGESQDLKLYHNGTQNYITAADGTLLIQADNIMLVSDDTAGRSLYQDNANSRLELGFDGTAAAYVSSSNVQFAKPITASTDSQHDIGTNSVRFRNAYVDNYYGSGANLTGIAVTEAPVVDYTITGDGSHYYFHGGGVNGSAGDPDLYLIRGQKYRFNNTTGTNHPFRFTSTGNKDNGYSKGVTGDEDGVQFWTIPYDAPAKLFYVCTIHSGMVGNIYIRGANGQNDNVGLTTFKNNVSIINSSGPILELVTNANAADAALRLSEGTAGSTTNGGGMFYSGADNKLHITCGTTLTSKRITILRDDGKVGINEESPDSLLHLTTNNDTDYSTSTTNTTNQTNALLRLENTSGSDGSGVNNFVGIYFRVGSGANSDSQLQYVRTGDNAGAFHFKARNAGSTYPNLMTIDSSGSVNKPKNPAFYAWLSTNNAVYSAGTTVPWDNTDIDTRSAFQTSGSDQGRYIIPTTGIYYFGWRLNRRNDSRFDLAIYKNGSVQYIDEMRWEGTSGMWMAESGHYLMSCTAGQKIDLRIYSVNNAGSGQFDGGGNGYYDAFFGWMVG